MVAYNSNLSYSGDRGRRIVGLRPAQAKVATPCLKSKRIWERDQVVEELAIMCQALGLIPSTAKNKQQSLRFLWR
jgi:hypothetical protein